VKRYYRRSLILFLLGLFLLIVLLTLHFHII
jgi:hypothetical protein